MRVAMLPGDQAAQTRRFFGADHGQHIAGDFEQDLARQLGRGAGSNHDLITGGHVPMQGLHRNGQ